MKKIALLLTLASFTLVTPAFAMSHMMAKSSHMCMWHGKKVRCARHHTHHHVMHQMKKDTMSSKMKK